MSKQISAEQVFPLAYGNEEETGMLINRGEGYQEPVDFIENINSYFPESLQSCGPFLSNGFKIYNGSTDTSRHGKDPTNLERATGECSSLDEIVASTRASEKLLLLMSQSYANDISEANGGETNVRIQRRVIDSYGNRKGCHDNFGVHSSFTEKDHASEKITPLQLVVGHLATRSFVTGAGFFSKEQSRFSQKLGGLVEIDGYSYEGSMYRSSTNEGTPRLEIRCNDINISDWAVRMRLGTMALAIAIAQTPAIGALREQGINNDYLNEAKRRNYFQINPDGTLKSTEALRNNVSYQRRLAETVLFDLPEYIDELPTEHQHTAEELLFYCNDFDKVLRGDSSIELLADRADWAAKLIRIRNGTHEDDLFAVETERQAINIRARDLMYDYIGISAVDGVPARQIMGYGYKLRNTNKLKSTIPEAHVNTALYRAPQSTRANIRAELLRKEQVINCDWDRIVYVGGGEHIVVEIPNVRTKHFEQAAISSDPDYK